MLSRGEQIQFMMLQAWQKGIAPNEFRKCLTKDLEFIKNCEDAIFDRRKEMVRQKQIQEAMDRLGANKKW